MTDRRERLVGKRPYLKVAGRAVSDPLNMVIAGASAIAAVAMHSWPVVAIGAVTYGAMVAWDLANPSFWKKALPRGSSGSRLEKAPVEIPDPASLDDPETERAAEALRAAREEIERALDDSSPEIVGFLTDSLAGIEELLRLSVGLIAHAEDISRHLAKCDPQELTAEVVRLDSRIAKTRDDSSREQYRQTKAAREEQLSTIEDLRRARERSLAQLGRAQATLEALPAKVVRMRALDREALDNLSFDLNAEIGRVNADVRTFEETIRIVLEPIA